MLDLWTETRDLLRTLDDHGVAYALVGAIALAIHGVVRATADIDLLVLPGDVEAALALARERGFTVEAAPMRFSDGTDLRRVTRIEGEDALTLDLMPVRAHLEEIWKGRRRIDAAEGPLWVVSRDGLIRMKAASGRDQDLADIRRLEELDR